MLAASLIKELFSLSDDNSHILIDIIQLLNSFTLFDHLFMNDRLLIFYITVSAV